MGYIQILKLRKIIILRFKNGRGKKVATEIHCKPIIVTNIL